MPLNERKIINILLEECKTIEKRCDGYQEELVELISEIIIAERQHRIQGTNIQQKISDRCNAVGRFLAEERGKDAKVGEDTL